MNQVIVVADAVTVPLPDAVPKATSRSGQHEATLEAWSKDGAQAGVWECDPGEFTTAREGFHEVCQILAGRGALIPEGSEAAVLGPGSTVIIPDGWRGVWRIDETIRKTYVIVPTT